MERLLASTSSSGVEPSWPQLLGSNNWDGLLDPLNLDLRHLILRCGNFSEATYDAFESDVKSKYAGTSKFGKEHFFDKVTLDSAQDYQVACFLYATADGFIARRLLTRSKAHDPWDNKSNFMGYIATTTDQRSRALGRREIYVVWRGTVANSEWRAEFVHPCLESLDKLLPPDEHHGSSCCCCCCCTHKAKVMSGWLKIYLSSHPGSPFVKLSARQQVKRKIQELVGVYTLIQIWE